jgi:hypothetical protein
LDVVIVAEALAGGPTVAGLTVQTGGSVIVCDVFAVTVQLRSTEPAKPFTAPTVILADDEPRGATAISDKVGASRVKLP